MRAGLAELLAAKGVLLADGATGTNYFRMGLEAGEPPELWNVEHPDRVQQLHRAFVDAGSDIILTNTFGGNRHRLKLHPLWRPTQHRICRLLPIAPSTYYEHKAREHDPQRAFRSAWHVIGSCVDRFGGYGRRTSRRTVHARCGSSYIESKYPLLAALWSD